MLTEVEEEKDASRVAVLGAGGYQIVNIVNKHGKYLSQPATLQQYHDGIAAGAENSHCTALLTAGLPVPTLGK